MESYVWDLARPNKPASVLLPPSPLTCLRYNHRSPDTLIGGCYNGLVCFYDIRKGNLPVESSLIEKSHHDPVGVRARGEAAEGCGVEACGVEVRSGGARSGGERRGAVGRGGAAAACATLTQPSTRSVAPLRIRQVYDVYWTQSKGGNLCCSASTDGTLMWWDTRRLTEPTQTIKLEDNKGRPGRAAAAGVRVE